jgi:hypothetical protein
MRVVTKDTGERLCSVVETHRIDHYDPIPVDIGTSRVERLLSQTPALQRSQ